MRLATRPALAGVAAAAIAAAGVTVVVSRDDDATPPLHSVAAISRFASCDDLLAYARSHAERLVGPYGLTGANYPTVRDGARMDVAEGAVPAPAAAASAGQVAKPVQQVDGVSEGDVLAFTDDGVLVSVTTETTPQNTGGDADARIVGRAPVLRLTKLDARTHQAVVLSSLRLEGIAGPQVLVSGDRAVVVGVTGRDWVQTPTGPLPENTLRLPAPTRPMVTRLIDVDLSDPSKPRAVATLDLEGSLVASRALGSQVRLAVSRPVADLPWVSPSNDTEAARERATETNRALVRSAGLDTWVPSATLTELDATGAAKGSPRTTRLLDCSALAAPSLFSGLDTLALVTADLAAGGVAQWDATGLFATGATVYATATTTYIAATEWTNDWTQVNVPGGEVPDSNVRRVMPQPAAARTQIHAFTTDVGAGAGGSRYLASGQVEGRLLGQWAMDEHDGVLRVATSLSNGFAIPIEDGVGAADSVQSPTPRPRTSARRDDNRVVVLARSGDRLDEIGKVGGFGKGESIRGVRFLGDLGYVVTYRQTDPLYTIDLRNPRRPAVLGELKVLGYSAFLQPVGEGRLLGIGRSGTADGRTTGVEATLFDVSDPAAPRKLSSTGVRGAWSDVEGDHHAFTWADGLALITYSRWGDVPETAAARPGLRPGAPIAEYDAGVLAVRVTGDTVTSSVLRPVTDGPTRLRADLDASGLPAMQAAPLRTVVVDGVVWTLTDAGIAAHDAVTSQRFGFVRF